VKPGIFFENPEKKGKGQRRPRSNRWVFNELGGKEHSILGGNAQSRAKFEFTTQERGYLTRDQYYHWRDKEGVRGEEGIGKRRKSTTKGEPSKPRRKIGGRLRIVRGKQLEGG